MKNPSRIQFAVGVIALIAATSAPAQSPAPAAHTYTRKVIELPAVEREHVMQEMQQFLVSIAGVMDASLRGDFKAAATAARASGRTAPTGIEKSIAPKLPPEFRKLAFDTHSRFEQIGNVAEKGDREPVLRQVTDLMGNCIACHAGYAIRAK